MYKPTCEWETVEKTSTLHKLSLWCPSLGPKPVDPVLNPKPYTKWLCYIQHYPNGISPQTYGPHTVWGSDVYRLSAVVQAQNAALRKVHDELRIVDSFFEDWYERKQAVDLACKAAKELLFIVTNLRNPRRLAKRYKTKRKASTIPEAWITYQFAIQPLVGTIDRSLNALGAEFPRHKVHGSSSKTGTRTGVFLQEMNCYCTHTATVKVGCVVTGVNPNRSLAGATGLNEPFSSAWAVIPWGWAVDYFVNVGELISNFEDSHPGVVTQGWYVSTLFVEDLHAVSIYKDHPFWGHIGHAKSAASGKAQMFRRTTGRPSFQLEFSFPQLGGKQLANFLSALALTFKGKR